MNLRKTRLNFLLLIVQKYSYLQSVGQYENKIILLLLYYYKIII